MLTQGFGSDGYGAKGTRRPRHSSAGVAEFEDIARPKAHKTPKTRRPSYVSNVSMADGRVVACTAALALGPNVLPLQWLTVAMVAFLPIILFLFTKPTFRLIWLCSGGLALLDTTDELSAQKVAYLAGVLLCAAATFGHAFRLEGRGDRRSGIRGCLWASGIWSTWIVAVTMPQAVIAGTPISGWMRDAFTQVLLPVSVVIGLDSALRLSRARIRLIIVTYGLIAAVQFAVTWTSRRGLLGEESLLLLFGSKSLLVLPLCMGLVYGLSGNAFSLRWLSLAAVAVASVLITGTRSGLLYGAAFLAVLGRQSKGRVAPARLLLALGALGLIVLGIVFSVSPFLGGRSFLTHRFESLAAFTGPASESDLSLGIRLRLTSEAYGLFEANPFLGAGVGVIRFVDTPLLYLAKFGLLGAMVLLFAITLIFVSAARLAGPGTAERVIVVACAVTWTAILVSSAPTEDKGFSLAVGLLVALAGSRDQIPMICSRPGWVARRSRLTSTRR